VQATITKRRQPRTSSPYQGWAIVTGGEHLEHNSYWSVPESGRSSHY